MSESTKAVFLSYASQDSEAAKRICEALRQAGVEVWFDQNELVGGDAWDQKIRKQIKECALLIPIISAATQARTEGYFRLEWRLADQRTHLMAKGRPFLLPVVIDDTRDADAQVPDSFTEVQWTRLPGGETNQAFCARVKQLLSGDTSEDRGQRSEAWGQRTHNPEPRTQNQRLRRFWWVLPIFGVTMAMVLVLKEGRREPTPTPVAPSAPATPAAKTVARVTAMLSGIDVTRAELDLAGDLLEQAVRSDSADAKLFATWAMLDCRYLAEYYDRSPARLDAARRHAAQAASLDGGDPLVRMARAFTMQQVNENPATRAEAAALLESVRTELPNDPRVLQLLGWAVAWGDNGQAAAEGWWGQQAKLPGQAAAAAFNRGLRGAWSGDFRAGYAAMAEADALGKSTKVKLWKAYLEVVWLGDLAAAKRTTAEVPVEAFVEDMPATARHFVAYWSRDFELALEASRAVPREFVHSMAGILPTGYFRGMAQARLGRTAAAENEWRAALAATERRLATEPNDHNLLLAKGLLLVALGDKPAAAQVRRMVIELHGENSGHWSEDYLAAEVLPPEEAISRLQDLVRRQTFWITAAVLRLNPYYDRFRDDPRFVELQAVADADPKLSPTAAQKTEDRGQRTVSTPSLSLSPSTPPDAKSVAVLAFANLSDDKGNEYFSDGISEELLNVLSKVQGLKVSARTSAFHFKGKDTPIPEIAKQLGVAYVVEGSVRKQGDKVRITAQLIKAADGFHVWSDTFTRDLKDIFAVQDEIAGLVAQAMQLKLGLIATTGAASIQTKVPAAYDAYLQARSMENSAGYTEKSHSQIVAQLEKAVELDPAFALGWAQLSNAHVSVYYYNLDHSDARLTKAKAAMDTGLRLAPDSPDVLERYGTYLYLGFRDYDRAREVLQRVTQLRPNQPLATFYLGDMDQLQGRWAEALAHMGRAAELDPINREILGSYLYLLRLVRRYNEAVQIARRLVALNPDSEEAQLNLAYTVFAATGSKDEGAKLFGSMTAEVFNSPRVIELRKRWAFSTGDFPEVIRLDRQQPYYEAPGLPRHTQAMRAAYTYEAQGDLVGARARLQGFPEELRERLKNEPTNSDLWQRLAQMEAILGNADEAERCIERAVALVPEIRDALKGVDIARSRASVLARIGRRDEAIAEYARFMSIPGPTTVHTLRHGAYWAVLRGDPKWEAVLNDPKNSAPLF